MKSLKQSAFGAVLLLFAVPAGAQMGAARAQMPRGIFNPAVGAGAQYQMQNSDGRKSMMEFAIVGKEAVNGKDGYWIETVMGGTSMGNIVVKTLAVIDGGNLVTSKTIMQIAGHPPMELPSMMQKTGGQANVPDIRGRADDLGTESVTTPAGTFSCHHYRMKDGSGDSWVSESVRPFGLVKSENKGSSMVLLKTVSDAKDKITGTPQPFNPMNMMQRPAH